MQIARFITRDSVYAFFRVLHEMYNSVAIGLQKISAFNTQVIGCPKNDTPFAVFSDKARWMIGDTKVDSNLFSNDMDYNLDNCNENCFSMEVKDKNQITMNDNKCDQYFQIICMMSKSYIVHRRKFEGKFDCVCVTLVLTSEIQVEKSRITAAIWVSLSLIAINADFCVSVSLRRLFPRIKPTKQMTAAVISLL